MTTTRRVTSSAGMTRRQLLLALGVTAGGAIVLDGCTMPPPPERTPVPPPFPDPRPFGEGVASGDPRHDGATIWTRVDPPRGRGAVGLMWTVAADRDFGDLRAGGLATAHPTEDHCCSIDVTGLEPDREYWYRFEVDGVVSRAGRLRTAPAPGATPDRLRFAFASCQQLSSQSWFVAHAAIAAEPDLDFLVHLGDYIYVDDERTLDLDDYRERYARWHAEPLLRDLRAALPIVAMWDDGEFYNGIDATGSPTRLAAATRAWFERFPINDPGGSRAYRSINWGTLADLAVLDVRSYRDPAIEAIDTTSPPGSDVHDPSRTTLGAEQFEWLRTLLTDSTANWRIVNQGYPIRPWKLVNLEFLRPFRPDMPPNAGIYAPDEAWDDYVAERTALLRLLADEGIERTVFTGGQTHIYSASDLRVDHDDPWSPVVAHDFVTGSLTADPDPLDAYLSDLPRDAGEEVLHLAERWVLGQNQLTMRHMNLLDQGYAVVEVTEQSTTVDFRIVDTFDPDAVPFTGARYRVDRDGGPMRRLPPDTARGSSN